MSTGWRAKLTHLRRRTQLWAGRKLPPGTRLIVGGIVMIGGLLGFLPVLGFWMLPLGAAIAALDVVPLWRRITGRHK